MKFVISLLFSINAFASPIHLFYEGDLNDALIYKDILVKEYMIPEELIAMGSSKKCEQIKGKGKLDLCLKNNGDLYLVSVDREFITESLQVFQAP